MIQASTNITASILSQGLSGTARWPWLSKFTVHTVHGTDCCSGLLLISGGNVPAADEETDP